MAWNKELDAITNVLSEQSEDLVVEGNTSLNNKGVHVITHSTPSKKSEIMRKNRKRLIPTINLRGLIDSGMVACGEKASYVNKRLKRVLKEGCITRQGIHCSCCDKIYKISAFEAHAGRNSHRPAANIFIDDGRSLLDLQMKMVV